MTTVLDRPQTVLPFTLKEAPTVDPQPLAPQAPAPQPAAPQELKLSEAIIKGCERTAFTTGALCRTGVDGCVDRTCALGAAIVGYGGDPRDRLDVSIIERRLNGLGRWIINVNDAGVAQPRSCRLPNGRVIQLPGVGTSVPLGFQKRHAGKDRRLVIAGMLRKLGL